MIDKRTKKYKSYIKQIDDLFDALDENNIIARRDWTCCNTCGCAEIIELVEELEEDDPNISYVEYVFYHDQEKERVEEDLDKDDIMILLNWGYCQEAEDDETGIKLAQMIEKIVLEHGHMLEYTDLDNKLALHIHL